jgi:2-hydroxychromene-2-carboxylate isomerase
MKVEFWFDFSCPYAYLGSRRIEGIAAAHGAELELCPMLLGGVFRAIGAGDGPMATQGAAKGQHNFHDMHRWAERLGAPFRMPAAHPMRTVRALRVLLALPGASWPAAMHALYAAYWQRAENITDDAAIRAALAGAGIEASAIDAAFAAADTDAIKTELKRRTDLAVERGVFGAPAFVVHRDGGTTPVLLWGQDRLGFLAAVLDGWDPDGDAPPPGGARSVEVPDRTGPARTIDFWFDFSSPFAYLGSTQIEAVANAAGAQLAWRALLLGGLFRDIGTPDVPWFAMPEAKRKYVGLDMQRWARWWGVPFNFPAKFPQRTVTALRLVQCAAHAPALIHRLFRAMWVEDKVIEDDAVLVELCKDAGVDPALVAATREPAAKEALVASTTAAKTAGVFGVPAMIVRDPTAEPQLLWGQDRLELVGALAATGAVRRAR